NLRDGFGAVGILAANDLRGRVDDRHSTAETPVSLREFEADIAAAQDDQMRRHIIDFENVDVGKRPSRLEAGDTRHGAMRADIEKPFICRQKARATVIELHFERFRAGKTAASPNKFGAA